MQRSLRDFQTAFAAHLAGHDQSELVAAIADGRFAAQGRLQIHRRHFQLSLETALASTFPTVAALVGESFFRRLTRSFIDGAPPADPVASRYGEEFSSFIAAQEADHGLPYLADVARLDWALNVAFHAPFDERLAAADLIGLPASAFAALSPSLASGTALIESRFPLHLIWEASQPGASQDAVHLSASSACLLVFRRRDDAVFAMLSSEEAAIVNGLLHCVPIAESPQLAAGFARLLGLGVLTAA